MESNFKNKLYTHLTLVGPDCGATVSLHLHICLFIFSVTEEISTIFITTEDPSDLTTIMSTYVADSTTETDGIPELTTKTAVRKYFNSNGRNMI